MANTSAINMLVIISLIMMNVYCQPYYVSYIDTPTCGAATDAACLSALGVPGYSTHNYNIINFAFYVAKEDKFYDATNVWANPSLFFTQSFRDQIAGKTGASDWDFRQAVKTLYSNGGVKVLLSVGGESDDPIAAGDATALATKIVNYVWTYSYDGVDIDFEKTNYFASNDGTGENWLIILTTVLRNKLGSSYIITHAPMAPYLGAPNYKYGAYLKVHQDVGSMINWYNVQFYNQDSTTYNTYDTLFNTANGWSPNTAVKQITSGSNSLGISVPANKIVIGKYIRQGTDGTTGWVSASDLKRWFTSYGWSTGFMLWQFPGDKDQNFAFSNTIIAAFGGSSSNPNPTPRPTPSPTTATGGSSGSNGNIIITNSGTLSNWWYAGIVSNSAATISKFEVRYDGDNWFSCTNAGWAWTCAPDKAFALSLTIRLTSSSGATLTSWSLVSNYIDQYSWDFGYNF